MPALSEKQLSINVVKEYRHMRRLSCLTTLIGLLLIVGTVVANSPQQSNIFQAFLFDTRIDLEILADRVFGGVRPESWAGNADFTTDSFVADLWFDNEQLADEIFGPGIRPETWIGATTRNAELITRNIRHDLEVNADNFLSPDSRPDDWLGAAPVYRCSRTIQNSLYTLAVAFGVRPSTPDEVFDYCLTVSVEIDDELVSNIRGTSVDATDFQGLIWAVRGDLERLADETQGLGNRPPSWIGNTDLNSSELAADTLSDMNRLADVMLGQGVRPEGWNGTISTSLTLSYRNLRQDLELLADAGPNLGEGIRPNGWQGTDSLIRCSVDVQNLVVILQQAYEFAIDTTIVFSSGFCSLVELQANNFAENPPVELTEEDATTLYESVYAFAYSDPAALEFYGIMPEGIEFRAWYRNFNGSTMMFVSGDDFAMYIDRRWTTMPQEVFDRLPTLETPEGTLIIPLAFCDAVWCNGPAPTPTPTGDGPLFNIVNGVTPPATLVAGASTGGSGKTQVSWNNIRVNYQRQLTDVGKAQVTLEICNDSSQIACEPVVVITDNNIGIAVAPISQFNGLNVYELPYGYSTNFVIEGSTFFSNDIWLNDPTLLTPIANENVTATPTPTPTP
jgi:hypothetical protein